MKGLSIWQPYASLIAVGAKTIETRHWPPFPSVVGQRIAIHAGATKRELALLEDGDPLFARRLAEAGDRLKLIDGSLPLGAIVATARLATVIEMGHDYADRLPHDEQVFGWCGPGRFGWQLDQLVTLDQPIPYRGRQGIFDIDAQTSARLVALSAPQEAARA